MSLCGTDKQTNEQLKIELLSLWKGRLSFAIPIAFSSSLTCVPGGLDLMVERSRGAWEPACQCMCRRLPGGNKLACFFRSKLIFPAVKYTNTQIHTPCECMCHRLPVDKLACFLLQIDKCSMFTLRMKSYCLLNWECTLLKPSFICCNSINKNICLGWLLNSSTILSKYILLSGFSPIQFNKILITYIC